MRHWSLGHLTVLGTSPADLVEIAARAGYDAVDPLVGMPANPSYPIMPIRANDPETRRMAAALKSNGLYIQNADGLVLGGATDHDLCKSVIEVLHDLGAHSLNVVVFDNDLSRALADLVAIDLLCQQAGIKVSIEFLAFATIRSPDEALNLIARTGSSNIRIMVDALHLAQADVAPSTLRDIDPARIACAQLCDAPANLDFESYQRRAIYDRLAPGEGQLPLVDLMRVLPADMVCSVEVPREDETDLLARARRMLDCAREVDRKASAGVA